MSEEVRAMYYPGVTLKTDLTRFGMQTTAPISLYERPIQGKVILKVDLLDILRSKWGNEIFINRDAVYKLVSGDNISDKDYKSTLALCYRLFPAFANYCDECYYFGDYHKGLHERFLMPVHELIDHRREEVSSCGRVVAEDRCYIYLAFNPDSVPNDIQGVVAKYA